MDIHIDEVGRQVEEEKDDRISPCHDEPAVRLLDGVAEGTIADPAAVDEQVLHLGVAALAGRVGNEAAEGTRSLRRLDGVELIAQVATEEGPDAFAQSLAQVAGTARTVVKDLAVIAECQVQFEIAQGDAVERLADMPHLR